MRVLHVVRSTNLFQADRILLSLLGGAGRHDQEVALCCVTADRDERSPLIEKANQLGFQAGVFVYPGLFSPLRHREFREKVLKAGVDVVHTHDYKSTLVAGASFKPHDVARVASCFGLEIDSLWSRLASGLNLFTLRRFDHVFAVRSEVDSWLARMLIVEEGKLETIADRFEKDGDLEALGDRVHAAYHAVMESLGRRRELRQALTL